jgi:hypothetical protein
MIFLFLTFMQSAYQEAPDEWGRDQGHDDPADKRVS